MAPKEKISVGGGTSLKPETLGRVLAALRADGSIVAAADDAEVSRTTVAEVKGMLLRHAKLKREDWERSVGLDEPDQTDDIDLL